MVLDTNILLPYGKFSQFAEDCPAITNEKRGLYPFIMGNVHDFPMDFPTQKSPW